MRQKMAMQIARPYISDYKNNKNSKLPIIWIDMSKQKEKRKFPKKII
jgi:hypothetical protein